MNHSRNRRALLKSGSAALAGLAPLASWARTASGAANPSNPAKSANAASAASGAQAAQALNAWRDSFLAVQTDYAPVTVRFDRALPAGLRGTLYRNGPALMQRGDTRYRHWFDGDGMVHAFQMDGKSLTHQARSIRTTRFEAEQKANRYLWNGFGTSFADARPIGKPDDQNVANISLLATDQELLALWEGGAPYRIDPKTLQTRGRKVFSEDTDGMPFSAHPRVDRDGTIWSFGYMAGSGKLVLYKLDRAGKLAEVKLIDAPNADMVHDFAITERYLVFVLMPLFSQARGNASSMLEGYRWDAAQASVVLVIDKNTLTVRHRAEFPAMAQFHLGNAWEDGNSLRVQVMRIGNFKGLIDAMYSSMQAEPMKPFSTLDDGPVELVVDLKKASVRIEPLAQGNYDFPSFDRRFIGQRTDHLIALRHSSSMPAGTFGVNTLVGIDRQSQSLQSHDYGASILADEHLFVPKPRGQAGVGWVIGTSYRWTDQRTLLCVFDAREIAAGPIAQAVLPRGLAPGLHGLFVPSSAQ